MASPTGPESGERSGSSWLRRDEIVLLALVGLSIVGIGITNFSRANGLWYWLAMVPLFGAASIWAGWSRAREHGEPPGRIVRTQVLHWAALALAVFLVYLLVRTGRMNRSDAALVALITLSLTTFLAGVHTDWRLCVVGVLLGATVAAAALVQEFFWVLLLAALVAAAAILLFKRLTRSR